MKRFLLVALLVGAICTVLAARSEYTFCVGGPGRGLPFALTHPAHGPELLQFAFEGNSYEGLVFDGVGALGDIAFWGVIAGVPLALPYAVLLLWRRRKAAAAAAAAPLAPLKPRPLFSLFEPDPETTPGSRDDHD
jgi:hypothetical protein